MDRILFVSNQSGDFGGGNEGILSLVKYIEDSFIYLRL